MRTDDSAKIAVDGVEERIFRPLLFRALHGAYGNPGIIDEAARKAVENVRSDLKQIELRITPAARLLWGLRTKYFDDAIGKFISKHPLSAVVNVGAGLDTTFQRVDNGRIRWYDLDLPYVINLRQKLVPETGRSKCIARSLFDPAWYGEIRRPKKGVLIFSSNVFSFFQENEFKSFLSSLAARFPGGEALFDTSPALGALFGPSNSAPWDRRIQVLDRFALPPPTAGEAEACARELLNACIIFRLLFTS